MKNLQKGQTIIEAVVALMIILLIITAIAIVVVNGISNSQFIKNQNEANKYAQQGMEFVRNIQKNNLTAFKGYALDIQGNASSATYCIDEANSVLATTINGFPCLTTGVNTASAYNRTVSFSPGGGKCTTVTLNAASEVTVTVSWSSSKCPSGNTFCHKSQLKACLPYATPASIP